MKKMNLLILSLSFLTILSSCGENNKKSDDVNKNSSSNEIIEDQNSSNTTENDNNSDNTSNEGEDTNTETEVQDGPKLIKKDLRLNNMSEEYNLKDDKLTTYYLENGNVPFVGVKEFITSLDGYYDASVINYTMNKQVSKLSWSLDGNDYILDIDCENNIIDCNDIVFFQFLNDMEGVEYGGRTQYEEMYYKDGEPLHFELNNYDSDIIFKDNDCLIPFSILNPLFLMNNISNMLYNGEEYFFFGTYIYSDEVVYATRNKKLEGKNMPKDFLDSRNNGLYFTLDYFYGLKESKNIDNFKDYAISKGYDRKLNNLNSITNEKGIIELLIEDLDDAHTYLEYPSYYKKVNSVEDNWIYYYDNVGPNVMTIDDTYYNLIEKYYRHFNDEKIVRYQGNTAFLKFDEFSVGYDDEIYNPDGTLSEDAYLYDTYELFKKAFNEISTHNEISNVVIDLSTNGGGTIAAVYDSLAFLTDKDLLIPGADTSTKESWVDKVKVDIDEDGDFADKEAYTQYNYYVLTSGATFSAANFFAVICKDMNLATIIGQHTGGGMCAVNEIALLDGTVFSFSSSYCLTGCNFNNGVPSFYDTDNGIDVDREIYYENFYDLNYVTNFINNI